MISHLKISVLTDNLAGELFLSEWGLSILIEADGRKILLDTGAGEPGGLPPMGSHRVRHD